jgi:hypothetical protein
MTTPDTDTTGYDVSGDLAGAYLTTAEVRDKGPLRFRIKSVERVRFAGKDGKPEESQNVLTFTGEPSRRLRLNKTNLGILVKAWGAHTLPWIGKVIQVEFDPTVRYGATETGGKRVRVPLAVAKTVAPPPPPPPPPEPPPPPPVTPSASPAAENFDDIPF